MKPNQFPKNGNAPSRAFHTIDRSPATKSFKEKNDQLRSNTYLIKPYNFDTKPT